jgi:hypothetical protein
MQSVMSNQQQESRQREAPGAAAAAAAGRGKFFGRLIDKVKPKGGGNSNNGSANNTPVASRKGTAAGTGLPPAQLLNGGGRGIGRGSTKRRNAAATAAAANLNTNPADDYMSQMRPAGAVPKPRVPVPVPNPTIGLYAPNSNTARSNMPAVDAGHQPQQPYRPRTANNHRNAAPAAPSYQPKHEPNEYALNYEEPLAQPSNTRYLPPAELPAQMNPRTEFSHEPLAVAAAAPPPTPQFNRPEGPPRSIDVKLRRQQLLTSRSSWPSVISDISYDDFSMEDGYSLRNSLHLEGRRESFRAADENNPMGTKTTPRRIRSSSFDDLETLQQLLEVFPNASPGRAKELLKRSSIRTAMNVLAEESYNDETAFRISGTSSMSVVPEGDDGSFHERPQQQRQSQSPPQFRQHGVQHVAGPPPDQQSSFKARKLAADDRNRLPPAQHVDGPPPDRDPSFSDRKPAARHQPSIRRRNSFTSLSEFEGDAPGLDTILEVFPTADEARSKYLLRQHSISTVLMILASESV